MLLGIVGATHPARLTHATAHHWFVMHVVGVLVCPLVGVALMFLLRGRRDLVAVVAILAAYVYATCYTAPDVVSGVGLRDRPVGAGTPRPDAVRLMFHIGTRFGGRGGVGALPCRCPGYVAIGVSTGWLSWLAASSAPMVARATAPAHDS